MRDPVIVGPPLAVKCLLTTEKAPPRRANDRGHGHEGMIFMSEVTVEPGYCQCGCGEWVGHYKYNDARDGLVKGEPKRFKHGRNGRLAQPAEERFWEKVDREGPGGCWVWTGAKSSEGYGSFRGSTAGFAHRVAYIYEVGPVPDGLELDHLCRNPSCVNPAHLEPVTHRTNMLRGKNPAAYNAAKTHCVHGHEFTPENTRTYVRSGTTRRSCRTCDRVRARRYAAKKALARIEEGADR